MARFRGFRLVLVACLAFAAASRPEPAAAWHGRWGGWGFRPGFAFGVGPGIYGGWYGGSRYFASQSVFLGGPFGGFFSGGIRSTVIGVPGWCGPLGLPAYGYTNTYYPYGWGYGLGYGGWGGFGCVPYAPFVVSPFPAAFGPVYGPAGIRPFLGVSATPPGAFAAGLAAAPRPGIGVLANRGPGGGDVARLAANAAFPAPARDAVRGARPAGGQPTMIVARASNGDARLRAAKLVAIGDRHLRAAATDRAKLLAALDAYRRAGDIAPDQADTFLRQAIVLETQGRSDAADKALARAVGLDARLGSAPAAALAARRELPPDPVFGDRPDAGPDSLRSRSQGILARIFRDPADTAAVGGGAAGIADNWIAGNWIAAAWLAKVGGDAAAPVRAIAAR
jgi:hypothetical protein